MRFLEDPFRGNWCECVPEYKTWITDKIQPSINDTGTVTVTTTPNTDFLIDYDNLYSFTTSTDTITMKVNDIRPLYIDKNHNTVIINNPVKIATENSNKESEDKKVTETKKQPRMFYNVLPYSNKFKIIKYGESVKNSVYIMPEISDVRHIINKDEVIGVEIKFADNTKQKAICSPNDTFNLEQGITICLFKKILENGLVAVNSLCKGRGTSIYNKLVNHALKVMERRIKAEEKAKKEEAEKKEKEQRFIEKKRRADERRANREAEQRINEIAEAIRRSGIVPNMDDGK